MALHIDAQRMRTEWDACSDEEKDFLCSHPMGGSLGFYAMLGGMPGIPGGQVRFSQAYGFTTQNFYERVVVVADICRMTLPDFFTLTWVEAMAGWNVNVSYHNDNQFNQWVSENAQSNALKDWETYQREYIEKLGGGEEE